MPTTLRIALLAGLLALASNLAVIGFVYWQTYDEAIVSLRRDTAEHVQEFADIYQFGGAVALRSEVEASARAGGPDSLIALITPDHRALAGNLTPASIARVPLKRGSFVIALRREGEITSHEAVTEVRRLGETWLVSARLSGGGLALRQLLARSLLIGTGLSLLLGLLCAGLIARFVDRRVLDIAKVAADFSRGDFERRAWVGRGSDAFTSLARQINQMLDRIATLMNELRLLSDGLAHDLRSPIGRLRAAADAALRTPDSAQRGHLLGNIIRQADELGRMLATVLEIGRSQTLSPQSHFASFDPAKLVAEVAEMYEPLAEDQGIRLWFEGPAEALPLSGHRQLIAQSLSNLVENALAYGAAGKEVRLSFAEQADSVVISVADHGPGIAPDQQALARRRFGRLDPSRSSGGAGLGLALVEAIAHAHGGKLVFCDNHPGLDARLILSRAIDG